MLNPSGLGVNGRHRLPANAQLKRNTSITSCGGLLGDVVVNRLRFLQTLSRRGLGRHAVGEYAPRSSGRLASVADADDARIVRRIRLDAKAQLLRGLQAMHRNASVGDVLHRRLGEAALQRRSRRGLARRALPHDPTQASHDNSKLPTLSTDRRGPSSLTRPRLNSAGTRLVLMYCSMSMTSRRFLRWREQRPANECDPPR